jgi:Family of unknown function (DUF5693)
VTKRTVQLVLGVLLTLSLIPALILAWQRIQFERAYDTVGLTIDYQDVVIQARENGLTEEALLEKYKALGIGGVSLFEDSLSRLVQQDKVIYRDGGSWRNERLSLGLDVSAIRSRETYLRSLVPGEAERFRAKYRFPTRTVRIDGNDWIAFPLEVGGLPAGPNLELISRLEGLGFFVAYRPYEASSLADPGADFPKVPFIVYAGDSVTGDSTKQKLQKVIQRTASTVTGVVESVEQAGMDEVARQNKVVRVFAIPAAWQAVLQPEETASKFVLAARERNHRLLYIRPYERIDDTETYLQKITEGLERASLKLGTPAPLEFSQNELLSRLSLAGPLLGLALFVSVFPSQVLGVLVGLGVLGISFFFGGFGSRGEALLAAIVFPVLGFALAREKLLDWGRACGITLMGGFFVSALGAGRNEVLALEPFRGVALTLVLPPLMLGLTMLPRQDIRKTIRDLWDTPVNLGLIAIIGAALGAVALVVLRRGNATGGSISPTEARVRAALQDSIIRPRTKELLLHAPAMLALTKMLPPWINNLLLMGSTVGQGSIIDSFAHYHTPLLISLQRTVNGMLFGGLVGVAVIIAVRIGTMYFTQQAKSSSRRTA